MDNQAIWNQQYANACMDARTADARYEAALEAKRPFMLLRPRVYPDGNMWCVLYGETIQEGVAGFGETPEKAAVSFDLAWLNDRAVAKVHIGVDAARPGDDQTNPPGWQKD